MPDDSLPDFSGKVVLAYVLDSGRSTEDGIFLEYAEFQRQGGRLFLLGRVPDVFGSNWITGAQAAVAWDSVTQYVVFKSVADYTERARAASVPIKTKFSRWWGG